MVIGISTLPPGGYRHLILSHISTRILSYNKRACYFFWLFKIRTRYPAFKAKVYALTVVCSPSAVWLLPSASDSHGAPVMWRCFMSPRNAFLRTHHPVFAMSSLPLVFCLVNTHQVGPKHIFAKFPWHLSASFSVHTKASCTCFHYLLKRMFVFYSCLTH